MSNHRKYLPAEHTGCVIMASGLGRRFGGNKLLANFRGKLLIEHILDQTDGLFMERVVVTRHKEVKELCETRRIPVILHELPGRNDTVRLGLQAMSAKIRACMFCPSDQPFLRRETLISLIEAGEREPEQIWRLAFREKEGTPVLFPSWSFSELLDLPSGKGGNVIVHRYLDRLRLLEVQEELELMDIDTRETLIYYRQKG